MVRVRYSQRHRRYALKEHRIQHTTSRAQYSKLESETLSNSAYHSPERRTFSDEVFMSNGLGGFVANGGLVTTDRVSSIFSAPAGSVTQNDSKCPPDFH